MGRGLRSSAALLGLSAASLLAAAQGPGAEWEGPQPRPTPAHPDPASLPLAERFAEPAEAVLRFEAIAAGLEPQERVHLRRAAREGLDWHLSEAVDVRVALSRRFDAGGGSWHRFGPCFGQPRRHLDLALAWRAASGASLVVAWHQSLPESAHPLLEAWTAPVELLGRGNPSGTIWAGAVLRF